MLTTRGVIPLSEERPVKISVYITPEQRAKFKSVCALRQQSMNEVLVEFIDNLITEPEKFKSKAQGEEQFIATSIGEIDEGEY